VGVVAGLAGPAAYAIDTATTAHTGSIPSAGPATVGFGGGGFGNLGGLGTVPRGVRPMMPGAPTGGTGRAPTGGPAPRRGGTGGIGVMGGLLNAGSVGDELAATLSEGASSYTWVAATTGANNAAGYQLATQLPVMPVGGFNGTDPSPSLEQFQQWVAEGRIHWFIGGGVGFGGVGGSSVSAQISNWVAANFVSQTVDGVTVYDLTQPS
jgi:hypothetical protein